ncbi:maleylpyruvate isomerase N-terminal domain-containing protein [Streptomyces sp. NPDC058439]|uniref:maleylpyruvate isomerase N-terminal domain-containing protein n=1 Tax=Streptomyces sp. NPDC058439 TaxID=3346500 RepID=UPI0036686149
MIEELARTPPQLQRALEYALKVVKALTPDTLNAPTPCAGWILRELPAHLSDSLDVLQQTVDLHCVESPAAVHEPLAQPDVLRDFELRAQRLLSSWTSPKNEDRMIAIGVREPVARLGWLTR